MKPFDYYRGDGLVYPTYKSLITFVYVYHHGDIIFKGSEEEYEKQLKSNPQLKNYVIERVVDNSMYMTSLKDYKKKVQSLNDEFERDLCEEFEVPYGSEKAQKCFQLAWDYGHSSGHSEVYNYFSEFVELIK